MTLCVHDAVFQTLFYVEVFYRSFYLCFLILSILIGRERKCKQCTDMSLLCETQIGTGIAQIAKL